MGFQAEINRFFSHGRNIGGQTPLYVPLHLGCSFAEDKIKCYFGGASEETEEERRETNIFLSTKFKRPPQKRTTLPQK